MALSDVVNRFKQMRRNAAWFLNYFKHSSLLSMIKDVPAYAFSKCTHRSLLRPFVDKITGIKLSICPVELYYSMSTAILLVGTETAERISYFWSRRTTSGHLK